MAQNADCRRSGGRLRQDSVFCNLGEILDISATGLRMQSTRKRRGKVMVHLAGPIEQMVLEAEVIWSRRLGFRRYEVGLRFCEMNEATMKKLGAIMFSRSQKLPKAA